VLPVLTHADWQVETVLLDRGTGVREWIEVRHDNTVQYCANRAGLLQLLHRHGLRFADFGAVDTVEDGCE
jgi:hypothetical protein